MKHPAFYASLLLLALTAIPAAGRITMTVSGSGNQDATFDVSDQMVIDFASTPGSIVVKGAQAQPGTFALTDATVLKFTTVSGVSDITSAPQALLRHNPVETALEFTSAPQSPCTLGVYSLQGTRLLSVDSWNGENVNVSNLAPGLYLVNFNNQSIKFYKK